jgi:hypothetical protein
MKGKTMTNKQAAAPIVSRMARYESAYRALHGRTASVTWSGEAVRVLEHGADPAYARFLTADELDGVSEVMEAKLADEAERRAKLAEPAPADIFEALGLPHSAPATRAVAADGTESLGDIFAEMEAEALARGKAEEAAERAAWEAKTPAERAAIIAERDAYWEAFEERANAQEAEGSEDEDDDEDEADGEDGE